ncbi:TVP38/TMEM64 family protein [Mastigocoleus testarum]|uniref:TVP38/TMEM64 family membrane protein n=1 Tax=Mastigocoleus testarum BC008 TaxID=371196 RepID=A0A0V7ZMA3_9CYAN|nr:VTT domain-containing protein [Mastigocoleus testarum]KST65329.1 hypothetical protein BC008_21270 [Mastigocoleus testarum BC008]KST65617.1 hypothetical protein BC008_21815 [Mastigocoleus testarum BC008]
MNFKFKIKKIFRLIKKSNFKKILFPIIFAVFIYILITVGLKFIGLERAQIWIKNTGNWAPILFVILCIMSLVLAPLSGSSLFITGGTLFGKEFAFILSFVASIIGCSINFWISKKFGRRVVCHFLGKNNLGELDKFISRLRSRHSILYITFIMPLSQDIVSYAVGLTKIKYTHFLISLIFSATVVVGGYIYIGSSLLEVLISN